MGEFLRRLRYYFRRSEFERDLEEEMEHHRALSGATQFGNVTLLKEQSRAAWGWIFWEQLAQDLRYALRTMAGNKAFMALAVLSLALGIGANTAIYSFMDSILLRSLPVREPDRLALLNWHAKQVKWGSFVLHSINGSTYDEDDGSGTAGIFPYPAFELFQKSDGVFSTLFAYHGAPSANVSVNGQAFLAPGEYVSGDYFRGLEVAPAAGRLIIADDDRVGAPSVVVLSYGFCQRVFGGAENGPGKTILLNDLPFVVVGVTPPGFFGVDPAAAPDLYFPLHADLVLQSRSQFRPSSDGYIDNNFYWLDMMGRLKPGVSLEQAQAVLAPNFANWVATTASSDAERANLPWLVVKPGGAGLATLRRKYSKPLYLLMTMVALILAIACANVANLLLARAAARRKEIALRLSVGAGMFRVVRQLLTESVLLASMGGVLGVLFAIWGMRALTALLGNGNEKFTLHAELNWHVLGVAVLLSLITGVLFGIAPAMQSTKVDVVSAMKETQSVGRRGWRISLSQALIVGQIAMSLLMLIAAGLFVRTLSNLQSIDAGFNRENLLLFHMNARQAGRKPEELAGFYDDLRKQFANIPGVRAVSLSNQAFVRAGFGLNHMIPGKKTPPGDRMLLVGPDFMKTMQIPMVAGREMDERDTPASQPIVVVNETFAKAAFEGENPIGQHIIMPAREKEHAAARDMVIVGIAKNAKYGGLTDKARPVLFIPYNQGWPLPEDTWFYLRTVGDPLGYAAAVREIVRRADSRVPVTQMMTQSAEIDRTMNQEIVFAELCSGFAILALVIACVGLYGTVSYNVARRTSEIGIRMALGAQRALVVRMILKQVIVLAAVGLAIGVPVALGTSKLVASFLYDMKANDVRAMVGAVAILLAAAILAGYGPARRASRIDPMAALRNE